MAKKYQQECRKPQDTLDGAPGPVSIPFAVPPLAPVISNSLYRALYRRHVAHARGHDPAEPFTMLPRAGARRGAGGWPVRGAAFAKRAERVTTGQSSPGAARFQDRHVADLEARIAEPAPKS
ncbi:hypothetical protein [Streptomyces lunalinharesii]|uniref:Uncharacterized protein n=1 Tax=Streptomyces lunalinharesii TaxID=333384 RepID=A0ABN3SM97_9ACTN